MDKNKKIKGFSITRGRGFQLTFPNGYRVSVQFGTNAYCSHYNPSTPIGIERDMVWDSDDAEVAIISPDGEFVRLEGWDADVRGYQTVMEVANIICEVRNWK